MANEPFPVHSSTSDAAVTVVAQLDLSELETALAPSLADPTTKFKKSDASRPDPAKPTAGPHRYTIYVPYDDVSRVNIGHAHPIKGEMGIAMETKTHINAFAFDGPHTTCLSLGSAAAHVGFGTNGRTRGYALHTVGASNHVAHKQVLINSRHDGMFLTANKSIRVDSHTATVGISGLAGVNISTPANVEIAAGQDKPLATDWWTVVQTIGIMGGQVAELTAPAVAVSSPGIASKMEDAASGIDLAANLATEDAESLTDFVMAASAKAVDKTVAHLATTVGLMLKFKKLRSESMAGKGVVKKVMHYGPWAGAVAAELWSIVSDLKGSKAGKEGEVHITAKQNVLIDANKAVSIAGAKGVNISGGWKGVNLTGLKSSMKGHATAAVWGGAGASVKSLVGDAVLSSDFKGATVSAKKDVTITSEAAKTMVSGDHDVQLNSLSRQAFVHGKLGVYLGAGTGAGCGLMAAEEEIWIGHLSKANVFADAMVEKDKAHARFKKDQTAIAFGTKQQIRMGKDGIGIRAKGGEIHMEAKKDCKVKGRKVLIG